LWDLPKPREPLYEENELFHKRPHLNGERPALELQAFMDDGRDDVAFVIIRTFKCSSASVMMAAAGTALAFTEDVYTKSDISKSAMQQIATCYFQSTKMMSNQPGDENQSQRLEQERIHPTDLFLFHHHHRLKTWITQNSKSKEHVGGLLDYVDAKYSVEFAKANSLFERGLVTQAHILKLFKPNETIISENLDRPVVYVLQDWPNLEDDGSIRLPCWSFQPDGSGFGRKQTVLFISPIDHETNIQTLKAYPLRFASPELYALLCDRGKKQWQYRTTAQVTYKGWNVGGDLFFVSYSSVSSSLLTADFEARCEIHNRSCSIS
jgi:hypothetical protein